MTTANRPAARKLSARLAEQPLSRLAAGLGAIVLAISGFFGGLEPTQVPTTPTAVLDQPIDAGPWRVTIIGSRLLGDLRPLVSLSDEDNHWLVVQLTVEVIADETWTGLDSIVRLSGVDGIESARPEHVVLSRDLTKVRRLHPGMPEKLSLLWEQQGDAVTPLQVELFIAGRTHRLDSLTGRMEWKPEDEPRALLVVPVEDRREQK